MKTTFKLIIAITILFFATNLLMAQSQLSSKALKQISKLAHKDAKKKIKEGFFVTPGALPMEMQLENSYIKQRETNEDGQPKYLTSTGNSVAESQTAAREAAVQSARVNLAGQIGSRVGALIEGNYANQQLKPDEAASVTKTVSASKTIIAEQLGSIIPLSEIYKNLGKTVNVDIILSYNTATAFDIAKKVIRKSLEEETKITQEKLEGLMNFKNK